MSDPAWFPSAAMQTIGAMYGIFALFFVLAVGSPKLRKMLGRELLRLFVVLSIVVFICILVNAIVLYGVITGHYLIYIGYNRCFEFFMIALSGIILYSFYMVRLYFKT